MASEAQRLDRLLASVVQQLAWVGGMSNAEILKVIGPAIPDLTDEKITEILAGPDCRTIKVIERPAGPKGY
jgi:hypothetical protein